MPKLVGVPGEGTVSFPDDMADEDISRVIRLHTPEPSAKGSPEWATWRNQRVKDLNDHAISPAAPEDKGFFRGLWDTVNPFPAMGAVIAGKNPETGKYGGPVQGIENLAVNVGNAAKDQAGKAIDAAKGQGEFQGMTPMERASSALGHGVAAAIPILGPAAAGAGEDIGAGRTGQGLGEAAGLVGAVVAPELISKGAPGAARAISPTAEDALRGSAEKQYAQALAPTTKPNKALTAKVVPELLDRGVTAMSLKGLQAQAAHHISAVGSAIGDAWDNLPAGTSTELEPVYDRLQSAIDDTHSVADSAGNMIPKGPEAERAIGNISKLQQTLVDVSEADPATGKLVVPVDKIRALRQYFDDIAARAGRYSGKDLADQSAAEAHGIAADSIRSELAKDHPEIAALNKEYSFWKNVHQITSDTISRQQGQSRPLGVQLARAGGFVKAGPLGAEAMGALTESVRSTAWRTASAVIKDRLADAIASGSQSAVDFYVKKIAAATGAAVLSDREQQTPQLVGAPTE